MSQIFISYSRSNRELALLLKQALEDSGRDVWIDLEDLPPSSIWRLEIREAIEGCVAFIYLLSPRSIGSTYCRSEFDYARELNKKIIPVLLPEMSDQDIPDHISEIQWLRWEEFGHDFSGICELQKIIDLDYEWAKFHAELTTKAKKWERNKDTSRLLRGTELREAEAQFAKVGSEKDPTQTELQRHYLLNSKKHEKKLKNRIVAILVLILVVIAGLAAWPDLSRERAIPGNWVPILGGSFKTGMGLAEPEAAYDFCLDGAVVVGENKEDVCPFAETLRIENGKQFQVELSDFQIMDNEVTNAQYQQCVDAGDCLRPDGWDYKSVDINKPATGLDWREAMIYCRWLNGRLPTEGEWEKAARGPNKTYFPWGNDWDPLKPKANLENKYDKSSQSIASFATTDINDYGVSNMAGNVREWTASAYIRDVTGESYTTKDLKLEEIDQVTRVITQGGAWNDISSEGMAGYRGYFRPAFRNPEIGFRCACLNGQECKFPWNWWWIWKGEYYLDQ